MLFKCLIFGGTAACGFLASSVSGAVGGRWVENEHHRGGRGGGPFGGGAENLQSRSGGIDNGWPQGFILDVYFFGGFFSARGFFFITKSELIPGP